LMQGGKDRVSSEKALCEVLGVLRGSTAALPWRPGHQAVVWWWRGTQWKAVLSWKVQAKGSSLPGGEEGKWFYIVLTYPHGSIKSHFGFMVQVGLFISFLLRVQANSDR